MELSCTPATVYRMVRAQRWPARVLPGTTLLRFAPEDIETIASMAERPLLWPADYSTVGDGSQACASSTSR
jgi:hypothetical protein